MRDTIEMAREAGCDEIHVAKILTGVHFNAHALERLVELVRADEREACAKVCESEAANPSCLWEEPGCWSHAAENCAGSIRARGKTK
jgi:hypothetical protein